jgi:hypothetical protein
MQGLGHRAKEVVMNLDEAVAVSRRAGLHLEGLTGDHGGMIGALPTSSKVRKLRQFGAATVMRCRLNQ